MSQSPIRPLSVGNVVSTGFVLYRSHLKTYLQLALFAGLWSLVPIYGWAKASTIAGIISRLAFQELVNQPESVNTARSHLKPRLWQFFGVSFLVALILIGIFILFYISFFVLIFLSLAIIQAAGNSNPVGLVTVVLLWIGFLLLFSVVFLWLYSRFAIAELPLAIENPISSTESISRSWELTKGFAFLWRIQIIILITFMMTLPIYIIVQLILAVFQQVLSAFLSENSAPFLLVSYIIGYFLGVVSNMWILPLWQSIKAVIYYDLRSRREGMGLELRVRNASVDDDREAFPDENS